MAPLQPSSKSQPGRNRNLFGSLPDDTLFLIAGRLGVKDRVCFLSCCRATRRYQLSTPSGLFPDLGLKLSRPWVVQNWVVWLARVKQQVGRLLLTWDSTDEDMSAMSMLLLGVLADSSMHTLKIDVTGARGKLQLGGWLVALRALRSLSAAASHVELGVGLSTATTLTELNLSSHGMHVSLHPRALPPALEALGLKRFDAASFGKALQAASALPQLKSLSLKLPNEPWRLEAHWDALAAHTQLTALALEGWQLRGVPHQLGALTALQELALSGAELGGNEASLEALTSMTQLSRLRLWHSGLGSVPASVLALPELEDLDLRKNPIVGPIPITSSHRLTRLALEASSAVEACEALTALSALRTLVLTAPSTETRVRLVDVARLIHSLS